MQRLQRSHRPLALKNPGSLLPQQSRKLFTLLSEEYNEDEIAERLRDHALFIAYAPADKPQLAVAVIVENGGHGGSAAAPVARRLFDQYLLNSPVMTAKRFDISR